jgi:K+-transporting ATPase ATPase C chain
MREHIRANLTLLVLTILICSILYPMALLGLGRTVFRQKAEGSLVTGKDGKVVGSHLIGQPFKGKEYFQPRPSAAGSGYDAMASSGSNLGASNPLLRSRVAQALGPVAKYASGPKRGKAAGDDVVAWFQQEVKDDAQKQADKRFVAAWASDHGAVAEQWVKDNAETVGAWLGKDAASVKSESGDVV